MNVHEDTLIPAENGLSILESNTEGQVIEAAAQFNLLVMKLKDSFEAGGNLCLTQHDFRWFVRNIADLLNELGAKLDEAQRLASTDSLTGLPNMRAGSSELAMVFSNSKRTGKPFVVLFIDGDDLRQANKESYADGDRMIRQLGAALEKGLRSGDFLARWRMGDEFLVILPDTPLEIGREIAERIRMVVKDESRTWPVQVTISVGAAVYPVHADTIDELLKKAEKAMKEAKRKGKDCVNIARTGNFGGF